MKSENPEQVNSYTLSRSVHPLEQSYRADIDGLRGVAVLAVLGFHAGVACFSGGFIGVDVFFVISGYLISSILFKQLNENRFSMGEFYRRRIRRIFPALIVVLSATWLYGWFALLPEEFRQLGRHIAAGAGFASNLLVANGAGYFDQTANFKPLLHLWSLGIEEQYYLLWPFTVALLWKARSTMRLPAIVALALASFCMNVLTTSSMPVAAYYMPHTRFWELFLGGALGYRQMFGSGRYRSFANVKSVAGITLIAYSIYRFDSNTVFPGFSALLPTLGTALLISSGPLTWLNRRILGSRVLVGIGLISYPLYLWHWPILSAMSISENNSRLARMLAIVAAFALALFTYRFVENPIRTETIPGFVGRRVVSTVLVGMGIVAAAGLITVNGRGLPQRLPAEVQALTNYNEQDHLSGWRIAKCFLNPEQDSNGFVPECVDSEPQHAPLVVLWGDSHAADLYPGVQYLKQTSRFRLAQFTASACPPIANLDQPKRAFCRTINDYVLGRINKLKPDTVILAGQFELYGDSVNDANVNATIAVLKQAGIRQVLVVGPNPEWHPSEPRLVLIKTQIGVGHRIPERLREPLGSRSFNADQHFRRMSYISGATYVSPIRSLCDDAGCLTKVSESGQTDLLSFDSNHLTTVGSRYVAKKLIGPYLQFY